MRTHPSCPAFRTSGVWSPAFSRTDGGEEDDSDDGGWRSSGEYDHHRFAPLCAKRDKDILEPAKLVRSRTEEKKHFGQVMQKALKLPDASYYSSLHVLINRTRVKLYIPPLTRLRDLDEIARERAEAMAQQGRLKHSALAEIKNKIPRPFRRVGENVCQGESIREIHKRTMRSKADRNNIFDRRFTTFGVASARSKDGKVFVCEVFRG